METNKQGFVKRKKDILTEVFAWIGVILIFSGIVYGIFYVKGHKSKDAIITITPQRDSVIVYDSIKVTVTVYHPTKEQCDDSPFETADGSIIDPLHPKRWCGASRDIVNIIGYGSIINLNIPLAPILSGSYILHDTDNGKAVKHIDILVANPDVCNISGKWFGYILFEK